MARRRILFLASTLVVGGAERVLQHLITGLDRNRFDASLAVLREPGAIGLELERAGLAVRSNWTGNGRLDPLLIPRLRRWLRAERFEAIYFLDHPHAVAHGVVASLGTPVRVRLMPVHTMGRWGGKASVPRSVRVFLPRIDRLVAICDAQRDYLVGQEGIPAEKIEVIPNGIPADLPDAAERARRRTRIRSSLGIADDARVAMILAVLRPEKNHELLLRAWPRVRDAVPGARLLVVGDGPRREALERKATQEGPGDGTILFLGARTDAASLWSAADVAVLCSHPRVETLPLALMEAMNAALPLVSTDVGGLRALIRPGVNGTLVSVGDADALADALVTILNDPVTGSHLGAASQELLRAQYRVETMVSRTMDLLDRLLR